MLVISFDYFYFQGGETESGEAACRRAGDDSATALFVSPPRGRLGPCKGERPGGQQQNCRADGVVTKEH